MLSVKVPFSPHVGSMGVSPPPGRGPLSTVPPDVHGGNLDTRHLGEGAAALFPVHAPGGLFSLGDVHAAQGDGEVGGTGVEVDANVTVRLTLIKAGSAQAGREAVAEWQIRTRSAAAWRSALRALWAPARDEGARLVTTGFAPDLLTASRKALAHMVALIRARRPALSADQALMVASMAADLRISQAVDMPHYSVAAHLPAAVLDE